MQLQITGCRLETAGKMQTKSKMQTANYILFKYIIHYPVLTIKRVFQANQRLIFVKVCNLVSFNDIKRSS